MNKPTRLQVHKVYMYFEARIEGLKIAPMQYNDYQADIKRVLGFDVPLSTIRIACQDLKIPRKKGSGRNRTGKPTLEMRVKHIEDYLIRRASKLPDSDPRKFTSLFRDDDDNELTLV